MSRLNVQVPLPAGFLWSLECPNGEHVYLCSPVRSRVSLVDGGLAKQGLKVERVRVLEGTDSEGWTILCDPANLHNTPKRSLANFLCPEGEEQLLKMSALSENTYINRTLVGDEDWKDLKPDDTVSFVTLDGNDVIFKVVGGFYRGDLKATVGDLGHPGEEVTIDLPGCFRRSAAPNIVWDEHVEDPLSANRVSWPGRDGEQSVEGMWLVVKFYDNGYLLGWRVTFWNLDTDIERPSCAKRGLSDGLKMDLLVEHPDIYNELCEEELEGLDEFWKRIEPIVLPAVESSRKVSARS